MVRDTGQKFLDFFDLIMELVETNPLPETAF